MEKIKAAIIGYGNIGRAVQEALEASPDFLAAGVVLRDKTKAEEKGIKDLPAVEDISELGKVDAAIICAPSRAVPGAAEALLSKGINTVDSFDIHADIYNLKQKLDLISRKNNAVSIISAGLDPGIDSVVRALFEAAAPKGITYTNFGPGMSMGHSTAVKSIKGVKKALSITIPLGAGIHRRMVYVELLEGYPFDAIKEAILKDDYFINDETHVKLVDDVDSLTDRGHGMHVVRKGVSGRAENQLFEFNMKINNPAATAQMMVASARASMKQKPGCYTLLEIPLIDLLPGDREGIIGKLV